jgi:acetyltransferase-like isoleucine patch superfamily enzyme
MKIKLNETSTLECSEYSIGENVVWGNNIDIKVRGKFSIGKNSYVGDRFTVNAEELTIGEYFYNKPTDSRGMVIGGGSSDLPFAKLKIGDRCTCHTGHINLARPVEIGDDVGLSHDVDIITHGFWASILEGYPSLMAGVKIGNNVIVGWKTIIMGGIEICDNIVIGANSTVVKSITQEKSIFAGSPAKLIRTIKTPSLGDKFDMVKQIMIDFKNLIEYYDVPEYSITHLDPIIIINGLNINLVTLTCDGEHDEITDAFRDILRRSGIRIFCDRPFKFNLKRK